MNRPYYTSFQPPDDPRPPRRRRKAAWAVWLLAFVVLLPSVGVFAYTAIKNPQALNFGAQPTRTPTIVDLATNRPAANNNHSSSATRVPVAPAAGDTGPVERFAALAADPNVSLVLRADASVSVNTTRINMSMSLQQSGHDFTLGMRARLDGRNANVKVVVKNGVAYSRANGGAWKLVGDPTALDIPATAFAFSQLKANEAVLVRSETRRGRQFHLLRVPSTVATGVDPIELRRLGCDTDDLALDLWVRDDGTPVSATFDYTCASGRETMVLNASYEFSKVNQPISIKIPPRFR